MTVTAIRPRLIDDDKAAALRASNSTRVNQIASVQAVLVEYGQVLQEGSL